MLPELQEILNKHKWFLEIAPSGVGSGNLYTTRCLNVFQFFTDEEIEGHKSKGKMRLVAGDKFAEKRLMEIVP
jgi:hypothetical protein